MAVAVVRAVSLVRVSDEWAIDEVAPEATEAAFGGLRRVGFCVLGRVHVRPLWSEPGMNRGSHPNSDAEMRLALGSGVADHTLATSGYDCRKAITARTRRWVFAATGSRSFWKMLVTCFSTPRSVRKTRAAIAEFDNPSAINSSTSRSRALNAPIGSPR